jgi:hypothetical protein
MRTLLDKVQAEKCFIEDFYQRKALAAKQREMFHATSLGNYAVINGMKKFATPYGTVFFREQTKRTWPEDDQVLVEFANAEGAAEHLLQTKLFPKKAEILSHIHATGSVPEGFREEQITVVQVRLRNQPVTEAA